MVVLCVLSIDFGNDERFLERDGEIVKIRVLFSSIFIHDIPYSRPF